jgi:hypothetical protein
LELTEWLIVEAVPRPLSSWAKEPMSSWSLENSAKHYEYFKNPVSFMQYDEMAAVHDDWARSSNKPMYQPRQSLPARHYLMRKFNGLNGTLKNLDRCKSSLNPTFNNSFWRHITFGDAKIFHCLD